MPDQPSPMPPLFATGRRTDSRKRGPFEPSFTFLDRVCSRYFAEVRRVVNEWFANYPESERPELRERLFSDDPRASDAAVWELLLHELYRRAGFTLTVHPELE